LGNSALTFQKKQIMKKYAVLLTIIVLLAIIACENKPSLTPHRSDEFGWTRIIEEPRKVEHFESLLVLKVKSENGEPLTVFYPGSAQIFYRVGDEVQIYRVETFDKDRARPIYFVKNWRGAK
jgi:hypothetical protein